MTSVATRMGGALGATAAFAVAVARGGLTAWAAGALAVGGLILAAAVLFVPSETPAHRLRLLIQAWQSPPADSAGTGSGQRPQAPPPPARDGLY